MDDDKAKAVAPNTEESMDVDTKSKTRRRPGLVAFGSTKGRTATPTASTADDIDAIMTSKPKRQLSEGLSKPKEVDFGAVPVGHSDAEDNLLPEPTKKPKIDAGNAMVGDGQKENQVFRVVGTSTPPT